MKTYMTLKQVKKKRKIKMPNSQQNSLFPETIKQVNLYDLQKIAVGVCRESFKKSRKIILKASCGFGKTVIAAYIIQAAVKKRLRALFLVDEIILSDQTSKVFDEYGIDHGIYQANNPRLAPEKAVQIGSVKTVANREIGNFDLIIIDEVHCFYKTYIKLMQENPNAFFLGLTNTPYTRGLGNHFDSFIEPITIEDMIKAKILCPYLIWSPAIADLSKLRVKAGEYTDESLSFSFDKKDILGDVVKHWRDHAEGKKTIGFGVNVEHIKHLADTFNDAGIKAVQIDSYQPKEERQKYLREFMKGDAMVMFSVGIAVKGFDFPELSCVMFILATKSKIKWEQGVGRGLRVFPGKEKAIILDFGGNFQRLGWPDGSGFTRLNKGEKKEREEKQEPRLCINCQVVIPRNAKVCPACDYDLQPEGAPLPDADKNAKLVKYEKTDKNSIDFKKAFLGGLNTYAENKGYKNTNGIYPWALWMFQQKFKEKPSGFSWKTLSPVLPEVMGYIKYINIRFAKSKRRKFFNQK